MKFVSQYAQMCLHMKIEPMNFASYFLFLSDWFLVKDTTWYYVKETSRKRVLFRAELNSRLHYFPAKRN